VGRYNEDDILSNADFSGVVGTIYDCALDPALWPDAIREVCRVTNCAAGLIDVTDLELGRTRLHLTWNYDLDLLAKMQGYAAAEVAAMWASVPNLMTRPLDDPLTAQRDLAPELLANSRYFNEWALPLGYSDTIQLMVLRQRDRIGALGLSRRIGDGEVTDRDLDVMRLLAPHIRRAVAISDVLNMQAIKISTFESALDLLQAGVLFVDRECRIHANLSARSMLKDGAPIHSVRGELRTHLPQTTAALKKAVAVAVETAIGGQGIGVPLPQPDGDPAHIHVLPLMTGETRPHLAAGAAAALFITARENGDAPPAEAIAAVFDLSPAEIRVLERLIAGRTPAEVADDLGSALPTVRTHLSNIFAKTGTTRQADLVLLAVALAAPVRQT
jgi:DNA-binding CsgD family transcriptional regulator